MLVIERRKDSQEELSYDPFSEEYITMLTQELGITEEEALRFSQRVVQRLIDHNGEWRTPIADLRLCYVLPVPSTN